MNVLSSPVLQWLASPVCRLYHFVDFRSASEKTARSYLCAALFFDNRLRRLLCWVYNATSVARRRAMATGAG